MNVYSTITTKALQYLQQGYTPSEAWEQAGLSTPCEKSTRKKGCPRSAFVSLAEGGYLTPYVPKHPKPVLTQNAQYCVTALDVLAHDPALRRNKNALWQTVHQRMGVERQNQNGVIDVLLTLIQQDAIAIRSHL